MLPFYNPREKVKDLTMAKKSGEDGTADTDTSASASDHKNEVTGWQSQNGLRHSVRPRRSHLLDEDQTDLVQAPQVLRPREMQLDHSERQHSAPQVLTDTIAPQWEDLKLVEPGERRARGAAMPVADAARDSQSVRAFDLLRTRLRQAMREHGWVNIAVTAPTRGCGNTFTAVNLALSLSRIAGSRTVLMDFNLRNPGLARAFDVHAPGEMRDYLSGAVPVTDHLQRVSDTLALGLSATPDEDAADVLQAAELPETLARMRAALRPEIVIYDMPAMLPHDDVSAFLPNLDGVLLVSDGTRTMGRQLIECERMLTGAVPLLGVVLNRARKDSLPRYR